MAIPLPRPKVTTDNRRGWTIETFWDGGRRVHGPDWIISHHRDSTPERPLYVFQSLSVRKDVWENRERIAIQTAPRVTSAP